MTQGTLLLKNIVLNQQTVNVLIAGNRFASMDAPADTAASEVMDCRGKALLPAFYNAHTHAAMTLLRGYADDMPLHEWLNDHIWPYEATLTPADIRQGSLLAMLEMVKSGTVFFNDMYWDVEQTIAAADQLGIRAAIGITMMDRLPSEVIERNFRSIEQWDDPTNGRIQLVMAPHALYTVSRELLTRCADVARCHGLRLHFHLSETEQEVTDCIAAHGTTPVRLLHQWGLLSDNCVAAHVVNVDDEEIRMLADAGVTVVHNPCSNMKLHSGTFRTDAMIEAGVRVALGTDGCSSNNNLSMHEEMKMASLLAKSCYGPAVLPIETVMQWATANGAEAFGMEAGRLETGKLADAIIVDLNNERLLPCHNLLSNWVYAADSRSIDSVLCDGRFVMRHGRVAGEEAIIDAFKRFQTEKLAR
ncbi:MAG: amidohydrolase [Bacteroidaceae bacterium]|nr:amidohydrolase [Bacteroidaceae bacterium]